MRGADVLLLDEPTAALDPASEAAVVSAVRGAARSGATVIVVAHRPALVDVADQVVRLEAPRVAVPPALVAPLPDGGDAVTLGGGGW